MADLLTFSELTLKLEFYTEKICNLVNSLELNMDFKIIKKEFKIGS